MCHGGGCVTVQTGNNVLTQTYMVYPRTLLSYPGAQRLDSKATVGQAWAQLQEK